MITLPRLRPVLMPLVLAAVATAARAGDPSWHAPHAPFRIAGNTWYVGTEGISVILVRGEAGAVLIDTGADEAQAVVLANLETIGVAPDEIKLILTSHAHQDHIGALAQWRARTGARVLASAESALLLADGGRGDLHFGDEITYPPVTVDDTLVDGETVTLGELSFTAHLTPGHTPGSTTWTWTEHEGTQELALVYADSLTAPGYDLIAHPRRPQLADEFRASFANLRELRCDLLITPHPQASDLFERAEDGSGPPALIDAQGCRRYVNRAERALERQIATQRAAHEEHKG